MLQMFYVPFSTEIGQGMIDKSFSSFADLERKRGLICLGIPRSKTRR
jgi:hypothetical protein